MRALRGSAGTVSLPQERCPSRDYSRAGPMMTKVHASESLLEIAHLRNVLESAGIACEVRNDRLGGVIGEIPFVECWPELWVRRPGEAARARSLIAEALRPLA